MSIPSVVARSDSFKKLVKEVPLDKLLTETDSPYQVRWSANKAVEEHGEEQFFPIVTRRFRTPSVLLLTYPSRSLLPEFP